MWFCVMVNIDKGGDDICYTVIVEQLCDVSSFFWGGGGDGGRG